MNEERTTVLLMITSQDWGGAQAYVFLLAQNLKKQGLRVKVCAGKKTNYELRMTNDEFRKFNLIPEGLKEKCIKAGIEFVELEQVARDINPIKNILAIFEMVKFFKKEKPKVVQLNSTMMGVTGSIAAWIARVPWTVYCIGGWVFNENLPSWKKSLYIWIEKVTAGFKDEIVCVHPGDEELARKLKIKPRHELKTIANGIDIDEFEAGLLEKDNAKFQMTNAKFKDFDILIGTVANAYPPKNLEWYLEVCKEVHEKDPAIKFAIIGDGPLMEKLRAKHRELGEEEYVLLAGRRMDAQKLYRAFEIFVLPSTKEGMSITMLEAMAAQVPILATDVGANRWMLDGTGVIVPSLDKTVMTEAIIKLAHDEEERRRLAEEAYKKVCQDFTWQKTLEATKKSLRLDA